MKVLLVVGTRPQFIKVGVLLEAFEEAGIESVLVHTGQHYDAKLCAALFAEMNIPQPRYELKIGSRDYRSQVREGVIAAREIVAREAPAHVVTIGDSSPALVGCLSALTERVPIVHVEAGLRSGNAREPEERNRIVIDSLSDQLFCSTTECLDNLGREGIAAPTFLVGDLLCDAWRKYERSGIRPDVGGSCLPREYCLLTLHRRGNVYDAAALRCIVRSLTQDWRVPTVWPMHPGVRVQLARAGLLDALIDHPAIIVAPPATYLEMIWLIQNSKFVATDSVGVQVEAYLARKASLVLRRETEHTSLVRLEWSTTVDPFQLAATDMSDERWQPTEPARHDELLFGDGHAAARVASRLCR